MFKLLKKLRDLLLIGIIWRKHQIGKGFHAGVRVRLNSKNKLIIGNYFYIGRDSQIQCDAQIGDYVMLGNKVGLIGRYDHNYQQIGVPIRLASHIQDSNYNWKGLTLRVEIEDDVWVGYGSIILSGVKIGQGSIIAAGSVVTKDIEPFSIYGGIPAKKIGNRFNSESEMKEHIKLYNLNYRKFKD
jgi:acetyltransferase-like isoleucine patch superfamily enzyme